MRHKITRLMIYNILGVFKIFSTKNFKNSSQKKKVFWEISKNFELDILYTVFQGVEYDAIG